LEGGGKSSGRDQKAYLTCWIREPIKAADERIGGVGLPNQKRERNWIGSERGKRGTRRLISGEKTNSI